MSDIQWVEYCYCCKKLSVHTAPACLGYCGSSDEQTRREVTGEQIPSPGQVTEQNKHNMLCLDTMAPSFRPYQPYREENYVI